MPINVNNENGTLAAYQYVDKAQKVSAKGTTFAEKVSEKSIAGQSISETNVGTVSKEDMTIEEYKQYIHDCCYWMSGCKSPVQHRQWVEL